MPKYFTDERKLPFQQTQSVGAHVSVEELEAAFRGGKDSVSFCSVPEAFPKGCLGYVFNIKRRDRRYTLFDILGVEVVTAADLKELAEIMNHVSGAVSTSGGRLFSKNDETKSQSGSNPMRIAINYYSPFTALFMSS